MAASSSLRFAITPRILQCMNIALACNPPPELKASLAQYVSKSAKEVPLGVIQQLSAALLALTTKDQEHNQSSTTNANAPKHVWVHEILEGSAPVVPKPPAPKPPVSAVHPLYLLNQSLHVVD